MPKPSFPRPRQVSFTLIAAAVTLLRGASPSSAGSASSGACRGDCRTIDVNIVFLTALDDPDHLTRAEVAANQIDILNAHFRTLSGKQIFQFVKKRHVTKAQVDDIAGCVRLKALASDAANNIEDNAIRNAAVDECFDSGGDAALLFDHSAINMYIFDHAYSDSGQYNGGTGYGKRVGHKRYPVIFVDIDRVSKAAHASSGAAQEHELGHAFGLEHVCQPATALHTSLMATSNNMKPAWFDPLATSDESFACADAGGDQGDRSMGFSDFTLTIAKSTGELAAVDQMSIITANIAAVARALGPGVVNPAGQPRF